MKRGADCHAPLFHEPDFPLVSSDINGLLAPRILGDVEGDLVIFTDFVHKPAYMNKYILLGCIIYDETKPFSLIVKFHFPC